MIAAAIWAVAGIVVAAIYGSPFSGKETAADNGHLITAPVVRGPFRISVNERGFLDSQNNAVLACEVPGSTTIISIVPAGTIVKKGDVVCQLDSSSLEDKAKQQQISVTQADSAFANATENLAIQKTLNESNIAAAKLKWELALLDHEKYIKGELEQERNKTLGQITLKEEELTRSNETLDFTKRMVRKGYRSQSDLEAQQLAVTKAEIELRVQKETLAVLEKYTSKRKIAELKANAAEYERELEREKRKSIAAMTKVTADLQTRKLTFEVEKEKYNRWLTQIENCKMKAPQDGEVVYATQTGRRGSSEVVIEEGAQVRERQAIINLPDISKMKVGARIHESAINRLNVGQPVFIRVNAFPSQIFNGVINDISSVPLSGAWPNTDVKEYEVNIFLTDSPKIVSVLRPGLTAEFEIISSNRENVLQVPVQAVINLATQYFTYAMINGVPQLKEVEVGEANDTDLEILTGLEEGTEVVMNPRTIFEKELDELEGKLSQKQEQNDSKKAREIEKKQKSQPRQPKQNDRQKNPKKNKNSPDALFKRFDTNQDGLLKKNELPAQMKSRFEQIDADKNGTLSKQELSKAFSASRKGRN